MTDTQRAPEPEQRGTQHQALPGERRLPLPNHEASSLSTGRVEGPEAVTPSEAANQVLYRPGLSSGHVESLFLKGNSPDGQRALWVKYTILAARSGAPDVAELWAIAFDRAGAAPRANKRTYPITRAELRRAPFGLILPEGEIGHGFARGALGFDAEGGPRLRWDLRYPCPEQPFRPFPAARMYTGAFPRTKTLTPVPDSVLTGTFEVDDEAWDVTGFRAAQGHNWGKGHAHAYAWAHANALCPEPGSAPLGRAWLEVISGRVRLGPLLTPWLTCAAIEIDGELFRFDGPRALLSRRVHSDARSFAFTLQKGAATLTGRIWADASLLAGLRYQDPDGQILACLNSKLAHAEVTLCAGDRRWSLRTDQAALELGTRRTDHGIALLV
jgi:hypothetical protein